MTSHTGKVAMVADAFINAQNRHDIASLGQLVAENVSYWDPGLPAPITGRQAVENYFAEGWKSFPDTTIRLLNRIATEDQLVEELEWSGTHQGPINIPGMPPIPPTGKRASGKAVSVARLKEGKIVSANVYYDNMSFMAQLGLMKPPGSQ